ncbi:endonuclease/exonuclease/phosphatase family protein [Coraliomargarita parva]|uniref:endonuclease/exonuclease/phosphatase family protein n=1 Tax=Coraliomargarita parva TaxID=3014050 RepID=UPI0022B59B5E|nr:endonuclease/exonuclease/phosphatase family protein [Coraliomargarita parva]
MTLNIAHGRGLSTYQGFHGAKGIERNLQRIINLLEKTQPDVVAFQEVDEDSHWNRRIHLLDYIKEGAGYAHSYLGVHNRRAGPLPLAYGNGLLSRLAIEHAEHEAFGQASLGEKGFCYTELSLASGHLPVVNLHLDFRSRRRRIEQVERLIGYLEARHAQKGGEHYFSPLICGDFNSRSGKPGDAVRHLFSYLEGHCAYQLLPTSGRTFPSILPIHGLDFIFVPPTYEVSRCEVLRSFVSDHRPVLVDLKIRD